MAILPGFTQKESEVILNAARFQNLTFDQKQRIAKIGFEKALEENDTPPSGIRELTGGLFGREEAVATTATAGAGLGVAAGGVGGVVGAAIGSGIGSLGFDVAENVLESQGVIDRGQERTPTTGIETAGREAAQSLAFDVGFQGIGRGLLGGTKIIGSLIGAGSQQITQTLKQAQLAGITIDRESFLRTVSFGRLGTKETLPALGAIDVAVGPGADAMRTATRVVGVFPLLGGPTRRAAAKKQKVSKERITQALSLDTYAPTATMSAELGIDMAKATRQAVNTFKSTAGRLYGHFRNLASRTDAAFIPTTSKSMAQDVGPNPQGIRDLAEQELANFKRGSIDLGDGQTLVGPTDALSDWLEQLTKLPDTINVAQYKKMVDDLGLMLDQAHLVPTDVARVAALKQAMETGLNQMRGDLIPDNILAGQIRESLSVANNFYSDGLTKFQNPTGRKIKGIDKNIFGAGPQVKGALNEDELSKVVFNLKSGQAISDLRNLVGDDLVAKAGRNHFARAFEASKKINKSGIVTGLDWDKFRRLSGLGKTADERAAMEQVLKASGVNIAQVDAILETASKIFIPTDVAQFMQRRFILAGLSSAAGTVMLLKTSVLGSIAAGLMIFRGAQIISKPSLLKAMRVAIDPNTPRGRVRLILARITDEVFSDPRTDEFIGESTEEIKQRGLQAVDAGSEIIGTGIDTAREALQ